MIFTELNYNKLITDSFVITNQDNDLGDVFGRLFQVSAAVSDLESMLRERDLSHNSVSFPKD